MRMTRQFIGYLETKLAFVVVLLVCLCAAIACGFWRHLDAVRADTGQLVASNLRARHLVQTLMLVEEAETGQRGYLLTGRDDYLHPYSRALTQVDRTLATLRAAYADDPAASTVAVIDRDARAKFAELRDTIELRRRDGLEAALRIVSENTGLYLMDRIRSEIGRLLEIERAAIDRSALRQSTAAQHDISLWLWAAALVLLPAGSCLLLAFRDAQAGRRESVRLSHASSHDALTGLLNRPAFLARLDEALSHRPGEVGLLYLDLDGFKAVNDDLGHAAGDLVLIEVARLLQEILRPADAIARLGGDEFVVMIEPCANRTVLCGLANRAELALEAVRLPELGAHGIGGSVGVAYSPDDGSTAVALLEAADAAMYARKAQLRRSGRRPPRSHLSLV